MFISHLSLTQFRVYSRLELDLPNGPVLIYGANAQGKTSLLEAIYYLATSRSPHTRTDRQLISWDVEDDVWPYARLVGDVERATGRRIRIEITLSLEPDNSGGKRLRKEIRVNGVSRRALDLLGNLQVVMFLPQDLGLIEGPPAGRRRYMNVTLCQTDPDYCAALDAYEKALAQRNALLKQIADGRAREDELEYWDDLLGDKCGILISARQRLLRELEVLAQEIHYDLTGGYDTLELSYRPGFTPAATQEGQLAFEVPGLDLHRQLTPTEIVPQFLSALRSARREEIARGMTLIGPHRDELRFIVNGRDLGLYGSRGQARTAVMALKIAEWHWRRDLAGEWPVLLLDEVIAELDARRRAYLLGKLEADTQALLTTAEPEIFSGDFMARATLLKGEGGRISRGDAPVRP